MGGYAVDNTYFEKGEATSAPLHAPATGPGSPNGVYAVGSGFPTNTYRGSNYWVDVVVSPPPAGALTASATLLSGQSETQQVVSTPSAGPTAPSPTRRPADPDSPAAVLPSDRRPNAVGRAGRRPGRRGEPGSRHAE